MSGWAEARPSNSRHRGGSSFDDENEKENDEGPRSTIDDDKWNSAKPASNDSNEREKEVESVAKKSSYPPKNAAPRVGPPTGMNNMQNSKAVIMNKLRNSQELKLKKDRKPAYIERDEQNIDDSLIDASETDENENAVADLDDAEVIGQPLIPVSRRKEEEEDVEGSDDSDLFELEQERQRFVRKQEEGKGSESDSIGNEGEGKQDEDEEEKILSQYDSPRTMPGERALYNGDNTVPKGSGSNFSYCVIAHEHGTMPYNPKEAQKKNNNVIGKSSSPARRSTSNNKEKEIKEGVFKTDKVLCTILRDRFSSRLYPEYQLILDSTQKPILLAKKMHLNRTSNYHLFDLSRGMLATKKSSAFSKKSGNYLGKLRAINSDRSDYVVYGNANSCSTNSLRSSSQRETTLQGSAGAEQMKWELGCITYERLDIFSQLREGSQPRKLTVAVPALDAENIPVANVLDPNRIVADHKQTAWGDKNKGPGNSSDSKSDTISEESNTSSTSTPINRSLTGCLTDPLEAATRSVHILESKEPTFENGNYRLNFNGRVSLPSVKNFQLVSPDNTDDVVCQFGKVADDTFHLDFKAPVSALQAFSFALSQFNL